jgi:hypothetical protein
VTSRTGGDGRRQDGITKNEFLHLSETDGRFMPNLSSEEQDLRTPLCHSSVYWPRVMKEREKGRKRGGKREGREREGEKTQLWLCERSRVRRSIVKCVV